MQTSMSANRQTLQAEAPSDREKFCLTEESDAYVLSRCTRQRSEELGIAIYEAAAFANAASEIAMNAIVHGRGGAAEIRLTANQRGIEVIVSDSGPGIGSLAQAFIEGHSTAGTLGVGLNAARRACEDFTILRNDSSGTSIAIRQYLHIPQGEIDYDVVSLPAEDTVYNRDIFLTQESSGDTVLAAVADLGDCKQLDHNAMGILRDVFCSHRHQPLASLGNEFQRRLHDHYGDFKTNLALLRTSPSGTECHILGSCQAASFSVESPDGICHFTTITSDGIDLTRISHPLVCSDAYGIASQIFNQSAAPEKDASVLVVRKFSHALR